MIIDMKNPGFSYELIHQDKGSKARLGKLHVFGKTVDTPVFMPVGTQATVKFLSSDDIKAIGSSTSRAAMSASMADKSQPPEQS